MSKFLWLVVFVWFAIFFLVTDITKHSSYAFYGWVVSAGMVGYFSKLVIDDYYHAVDDDGS